MKGIYLRQLVTMVTNGKELRRRRGIRDGQRPTMLPDSGADFDVAVFSSGDEA